MPHRRILALAAAIVSFFILVGFSPSGVPQSFFSLPSIFVLILVCSVFLTTFLNTNLALCILIFSMLLSPELPLFKVPDRAVVVRVDDLLLAVVFLSWLAKTALTKGVGFLKYTPVNKPMLIYIALCIIVTASMIILGVGLAKFSNAVFYILKYAEYFILFFLVNNNVRSAKQIKIFTVLMLVVCCIVGIVGYVQIHQGVARITAPFEGERAEPNTMAGYLTVMFGLMGGVFLASRSRGLKIILGMFAAWLIPVFLYTLSRGGYTAFVALFIGFALFGKRARVFLLMGILILLILAPRILPLNVMERIRYTFQPGKTVSAQRYEVLGKRFDIEASAAARIDLLTWLIPLWLKSPVFGLGVTGVGFVEGQYVRTLGELGVVGLVVFFWLLARLFKSLSNVYNSIQDDLWLKGVSLGVLASLFALCVHALSANVFIIVRIMEPFWFLVAMVLAIPHFEQTGDLT